MNGVDLQRFQFDYDLTWAALFLHHDGTVLGRYGSSSADGPMSTNSLAGLQRTMGLALDAYRSLPTRRAEFALKVGPKPDYSQPEKIPSKMIGRAMQREGTKGCIHCHMVHDGLNEVAASKPSYDPKAIYKYPFPENVGFSVEKIEQTKIASVRPGSPAYDAGLRAGDVIDKIDGQPILSLADIQFVLHFKPESAKLKIDSRRGGETHARTLQLSPGWRANDFSWRGSLWAMPPAPGLWAQELDADERKRRDIPDGKLAIKVRGLFKPAVRKALKKNDIIVSYDGRTDEVTGAQFHMYLRLNKYKPGSAVDLEVLRGGKRRKVRVEF